MLNIKIIATGNLKESYLRAAADEYRKRLGAWARVEEIELKEEKLPENPSQSQIESALEKEAKAIFEKEGYTVEEAIIMFFKACIAYNGFPFPVTKEELLDVQGD